MVIVRLYCNDYYLLEKKINIEICILGLTFIICISF